jgi:hypothetical protein
LPAGFRPALRTVSLLVRALLLSGSYYLNRDPEAAFERPLFLPCRGAVPSKQICEEINRPARRS